MLKPKRVSVAMPPRTRSMAKQQLEHLAVSAGVATTIPKTPSPFSRLPFDIRWHISSSLAGWMDFLAFRQVDPINMAIGYRSTSFRTTTSSIPEEQLVRFSNHLSHYETVHGLSPTHQAFMNHIRFRPAPYRTDEKDNSWYAVNFIRKINEITNRIKQQTPDDFLPMWSNLNPPPSVRAKLPSGILQPADIFTMILEMMSERTFFKARLEDQNPDETARDLECLLEVRRRNETLHYVAMEIASMFGNAVGWPWRGSVRTRDAEGRMSEDEFDVQNPYSLVFHRKTRIDEFLLFRISNVLMRILWIERKNEAKLTGELIETLRDCRDIQAWVEELEYYWQPTMENEGVYQLDPHYGP